MRKIISSILVLLSLAGISMGVVYAQTSSQLELGMSRDFGYGGFGNDIQGLFTIRVKNPPENLARVVFYIDSTSMGEVTKPPFSLQFNTDSYSLGTHTLSAIGYTSDGTELNSNQIVRQFVAASAGTQAILKVVIPIVGLLVIIGLAAVLFPLLTSKGKLSTLPAGAERKYGIGGGAICPKCGRPFPLRLWWINLGLSKIDRCPFCGKWSMVRPRSLQELRAAEAAEITKAQEGATVPGESEAEKLKKELDDSRYQSS